MLLKAGADMAYGFFYVLYGVNTTLLTFERSKKQ